MIRFHYSKTTSNIHNIQYTSNIHICNKNLYIPFCNILTLLVIIFSVFFSKKLTTFLPHKQLSCSNYL